MSEPSISELLKILQKLELQSDSINVKRKIIFDTIVQTTTRVNLRPVRRERPPECPRSPRRAAARGPQRANRANRPPSLGKGDRVYICNLVKPVRGRRPTDFDRYATVRFVQSTDNDENDQVYLTTNSGTRTYHIRKNLRRLYLHYCEYEQSRR